MSEEEFRRNSILASLPDREYERLRPRLELVDAAIRTQVYEPGGAIPDVYFPLTSVFSIVAITDERIVVEVATTGREGMVGLPVFLGASRSPHAAYCQVAGLAARLSAEDLRRFFSFDGALHRALNRFTESTMVQIAQNVACNNTHSTEQRAARWLLTTRDRVGKVRFQLTQEFLAQMLGVRRPTVSLIASRLQSKGLICYRRGDMEITNPPALEAAACQCYAIVRAEFDQLFPGG